jgi:hypothetical protein
MNLEERIERFVRWFLRESNHLKMISSQEAACEIEKRLRRVDERLGVEVERSGPSKEREIIFTAFSNRPAFTIIHKIVRKIGILAGWKVIPLKPPRGFEFSLIIEGQKIQAQMLKFKKIAKAQYEYQLLSPGACVSGAGAERLCG